MKVPLLHVEQTVSVVQYKPVVSAALQTLARGTAYKGGAAVPVCMICMIGSGSFLWLRH